MRMIVVAALLSMSSLCSSQAVTFGIRGNDSIIIFKQGNDTVGIEAWSATHPLYEIDFNNISIVEQFAVYKYAGIRLPVTAALKTLAQAKSYVDNHIASVTPAYRLSDAGVVTQLNSKASSVTINKKCGRINTSGSLIGAGVRVTFTVFNDQVTVNDIPRVVIRTGGENYRVDVTGVANGSFQVTITNVSLVSLSQAVVLNFDVTKMN